MANALFDKGRELFLTGGINWLSADIRCCLVDMGLYTLNLAGHTYLSEVGTIGGGGSIRMVSGNFTTKTATGGAADADNITFSAVSGTSLEAIIIYQHITDPASSPLLAFIDTATGLPITPNGGDIIVTWDNGPNKIFKL